MDPHLLSCEVDPDSVVLTDGVPVRPASSTSALEVLATDQTSVDIDIAQRLRAQAFEVKVQITSGYLAKVS